jgi:hypothetical protein
MDIATKSPFLYHRDALQLNEKTAALSPGLARPRRTVGSGPIWIWKSYRSKARDPRSSGFALRKWMRRRSLVVAQ